MAMSAARRISPMLSLRHCFLGRGLAAQAEQALDEDQSVTVSVTPFKAHRIDDPPGTEVETSKKELLQMFKDMYRMRRQVESTQDSQM